MTNYFRVEISPLNGSSGLVFLPLVSWMFIIPLFIFPSCCLPLYFSLASFVFPSLLSFLHTTIYDCLPSITFPSWPSTPFILPSCLLVFLPRLLDLGVSWFSWFIVSFAPVLCRVLVVSHFVFLFLRLRNFFFTFFFVFCSILVPSFLSVSHFSLSLYII